MSSASAELGELVAGAVGAVVRAQTELDRDAVRRTWDWLEDDGDELTPPPLWYAFGSVALEVQMSAHVQASGPARQPALVCRPVDPTTAGLYGYEASSGIRLRLLLERQGSSLPLGGP